MIFYKSSTIKKKLYFFWFKIYNKKKIKIVKNCNLLIFVNYWN